MARPVKVTKMVGAKEANAVRTMKKPKYLIATIRVLRIQRMAALEKMAEPSQLALKITLAKLSHRNKTCKMNQAAKMDEAQSNKWLMKPCKAKS